MAEHVDAQKIRIRMKAYDFKLLDQSAGEIVDTAHAHRRARGGADPAADPINKYTVLRGAAHRQEVARAVRDPHAQAADRHPRADAADAWTR